MSSHLPTQDFPPTRTLSERAYRLLRDDILAGRLEPGSKLKLQALQKRYGLGISPIREALMMLSNERLAANEGQRGFSVAEVSAEDLADIVKARRHIEGILLKEAIENGDDEWGAAIAAAYYKLARTPLPSDTSDDEAIERFERAHRNFHLAMLSGARSPWLLRIDEQLVAHSERYRRIRLLHVEGVQSSSAYETREEDNVVAEHERLMQAVLDKNLPAALALLDQHIGDTGRLVADYLGYDGKGAPATAKPSSRAPSRRPAASSSPDTAPVPARERKPRNRNAASPA
nr:Bacterial regulatory protein, gntR family [uncultured organism]